MAEGIFVIIEQRVEALLFCVETAVCFLWRQKSFACPAYDGEGQSIAHRFHCKPQEKRGIIFSRFLGFGLGYS